MFNSRILKTVTSALALSLTLGQSAFAEYDGPGTTTLRNPLVPGAQFTAPNTAPTASAPPPPGSGTTPVGVTPGMTDSPTLPPSVLSIPADQIDQSNSQQSLPFDPSNLSAPRVLGKSLTVPSPPSTPGTDPGMFPGPIDFTPPPAAVVPINPEGGMPGDNAPQQRWGAQTTRDWGLVRTGGSQLYEFGQKLTAKPDLKTTPQESQNGPRQMTYPGQLGSDSNRTANLTGAQTTQDWYGNRRFFKSSDDKAVQTIAPY